MPATGLDVRVLAELVPADQADRVRRRARRGVELDAQGLPAPAMDDASAADLSGVEAGCGRRHPDALSGVYGLSHPRELLGLAGIRARVDGRPVVGVPV